MNERSGKTEVNGIKLDWDQTGQGPDLIWGHGLTSNRANENSFGFLDWAHFGHNNRRTRYDARGHGLSDYSSEPSSYGWDQMAADQLALATELGIDTYIAGGASLGAATALHAAVQAPDRVTALLLVIPPTGWETRAAQIGLYEQLATGLETVGPEPVLQAMSQIPDPAPFLGRTDWSDYQAESMRTADLTRLPGLFRGAVTADLPTRDEIASIKVPTCILAWDGDSGHPVSSAMELHRLISGSSVAVASSWEDFADWTDQANGFLADLAS